MVIAIVAVTLRFVSRRLCKVAILADDYVCLAALVFAIGEATGGLMCVRYGGGKHAVLLKNPETFAKWVIATEIFYNSAITTIKLSILLLYARLFPFPHLKRIIWSVSGFVVSCWLTIILLTIFQCRPIRAAWNISVKGHCLKLNVAYIVLGTCNTITDMIALCLPMPLIWRLQTDKPRKIQLICVFSLGGLVCGVSLYRIPKMAQLSLSDAPWSDVDACVWGIVEVCLAILSACTPTYPALFRWRKVRRNSRPVAGDVKRSDSAGYRASTPDERRFGFRSDVRLAGDGAVKMDDWSEVSKDEERGNAHVEGTTLSW